jgi:hypothetical protein
MYQFNNLTSNVPNVQTFNATGPTTYASLGTTSYVYLGVNATGVPAANGDFYQRTTTTVAYFKTDSTGATAPTPLVNDRFTYGNGTTNGWINATITVVTDSTTYWLLTLGTAFAGALTTSSTYTLDDLRPIYPWQSWTKPNDAMLIHILCIGGGGGGGSGRVDSTAGTNKYGGGGGGSAAVTSMYVPAFLIPDTLYIQVGVGGAGGAAQTVNATNGNAGTIGGTSYVALYPLYTGTQYGNLLLSANGGGAGGAGTATTGTAGGAAAAITTGATSPFYFGLGQFTSTAGQAGTASAIAAAPTSLTISGITGGGAAGGGIQQTPSLNAAAGGAISSPSALIPYLTSLAGGVANSTDASVINSGYAVKKPLMFIGGTGSGAKYATAATSKNGGNGAIGSGGGGSGAAAGLGGAFVSGAGGKGGDGIVIITSYSI